MTDMEKKLEVYCDSIDNSKYGRKVADNWRFGAIDFCLNADLISRECSDALYAKYGLL